MLNEHSEFAFCHPGAGLGLLQEVPAFAGMTGSAK